MSRPLRAWLRRLLVLAVLGALVGGAVLIVRSCRRPRDIGGLYEQLRITRRSLFLSERDDRARVLAEIENAGPQTVPAVRVIAELKARNGTLQGSDSIVLEDLAPEERRTFSVEVDYRGRVKSIDFRFAPPAD
jgi:hypothetical protein